MRWKISWGSLTGSGLQTEACRSVKMAVFAPIPRVNVSTATAVKAGLLRSIRIAKRKSCQHVSTNDSQPAERTTSFVTLRLPRSNRTARSASFRLIPCFIFSSAAISRKPFSSSSSSRPTCSFRNNDRNPPDRFRSSDMVRLRRLQDSADHRDLTSAYQCFAVGEQREIIHSEGQPRDRPLPHGTLGWRQRCPLPLLE